MSFTTDRLYQVLSGWPTPVRYRVALSGGLDSTVLLHALAALRDRLDAPVAAIHADHGLQADSGDWSSHCVAQCASLDIPLETVELKLQPVPGESIEAVAREARYAAFARTMQVGELLLTAQHQDDQAETMLLQLLRGAGVAGLAAMPDLAIMLPGQLGRPLLGFGRAELETYAGEAGLSWVEDPSNRLLDFDRNYLRHEVMPRLTARWPAAARTLSRSAAHCATADKVLRDFAGQDLRQCRLSAHCLAMAPFGQLPAERQFNLLRAWIEQAGLPMPPTRKLERVLNEMIPAREDAQPLVEWPGAALRRYRDTLWLTPPLPSVPPGWQVAWGDEETVALPEGLGMLARRAGAGGIAPEHWASPDKQLVFRREGLTCMPAGRQGSRSLKKLFQELDVPPWLRERIPLLLIGGELAAVGDYCVCAPFAAAGEGSLLDWRRPGWLDEQHGEDDEEE